MCHSISNRQAHVLKRTEKSIVSRENYSMNKQENQIFHFKKKGPIGKTDRSFCLYVQLLVKCFSALERFFAFFALYGYG